jgi:hypothetical protein
MLTSWVDGFHFVLEMTWPATVSANAGSGQAHLFSRIEYTVNGNGLALSIRACGAYLPEAELNGIGTIAAGGSRVLVEIPESLWGSIVTAPATATGLQSGWDVGSTIQFAFTSTLGVTLSDPTGPWPDSGIDMNTVDAEADGFPGYTAVPRDGGGFVLPPTTVGLLGLAPAADRLYLVSRQNFAIHGTRTACDAHSGALDVAAFDNHVVGCHVRGGNECTEEQFDFIDQNRTKYAVTSATYQAKAVPVGAPCADVRAAVP